MSWLDSRACADLPLAMFFPEKGSNGKAAKAVCAGCPVKAECLAEALAFPDTAGIWGGTSEAQRIEIGRPRRRKSVAQCGTDAGYYRHKRFTFTEPCDPCREAHAAYVRATRPPRPARLRGKTEAAA